jgi:hypothetical protein
MDTVLVMVAALGQQYVELRLLHQRQRWFPSALIAERVHALSSFI